MKFRNVLFATLLFGLTACGPATVGLLDPDTLYPDAITHCAPDPTVPARPAAGQPRSDDVKADYLKSVHAAGVDCRDTVGAVAERKKLYVDQYQAQTEDFFTRTWNSVTKGAGGFAGGIGTAFSSISPF